MSDAARLLAAPWLAAALFACPRPLLLATTPTLRTRSLLFVLWRRRNCDNNTAADLATGSETATLLSWEAAGRELLAAGQHGAPPDALRAALQTMPASFASADTQATVLHVLAANTDADFAVAMLPAVVEAGADLAARDSQDRTPLHVSADAASPRVTSELLRLGAKPDLRDQQGRTPLFIASAASSWEVCRILLHAGADPTVPAHNGDLPSGLPTETSQTSVVRMLQAATAGNLPAIEELVAADPTLVHCRDLALDGRQSTPLHFAAGYNRADIVRFLLDNGADVNARDKGGLVPLHNACSFGHTEATEVLVADERTDVDALDQWKYTPLHEAVAKGKSEAVRILLTNGASCNKRNCDGKLALDLVRDGFDDISDMLRGELALLDAARRGQEPRIQRLCGICDVNCRDTQGRHSTPLHLAAGYNHLRACEVLLEIGADANASDRGGLIPLHNAASYGHTAVAELLVKHGSCVNATDKWLFSPLHEAAQKGRVQLTSLLVSHGADLWARTKDGMRPVDLAATPELKALLEELTVASELYAKAKPGRPLPGAPKHDATTAPVTGDTPSRPRSPAGVAEWLSANGFAHLASVVAAHCTALSQLLISTTVDLEEWGVTDADEGGLLPTFINSPDFKLATALLLL